MIGPRGEINQTLREQRRNPRKYRASKIAAVWTCTLHVIKHRRARVALPKNLSPKPAITLGLLMYRRDKQCVTLASVSRGKKQGMVSRFTMSDIDEARARSPACLSSRNRWDADDRFMNRCLSIIGGRGRAKSRGNEFSTARNKCSRCASLLQRNARL